MNDLGNQDPLDNLNLDFSLPFPPSKPPADPIMSLPTMPPPSASAPKPEARQSLPGATSESEDILSEPEEPRSSRPQRSARGRAASLKTKAEKAEPRNAAAQRKHLALQEKNRRAQRRFRERQKQRVVELEEQVAQLTTELTQLAVERDALAQRNLELESNTNNSAGNNLGSGDSPHDHLFAAQHHHQHLGPLHHHASDTCSDGVHSPSPSCSQGLTLTIKPGSPGITLTPAELCSMSQPVLSSHFSSLVKECAKTFVEGAGTAEVDDRVCDLVDQALQLWHRVAQCNPAAAKQFATVKLDENGRGQPADERAPHIVRSLGLSDIQKGELCNLRRLFVQNVATIATARSSAAGHSLAAHAHFGGTSGRALASHQLLARQASRHVASSLQAEHTTAVEFDVRVTRQVLTPAQAAQLLIQSYPWPPDCLALATWVAAENGDADALGALAAEAQARAATAAAAVAAGSHAMVHTGAVHHHQHQHQQHQHQQQQQQSHMQMHMHGGAAANAAAAGSPAAAVAAGHHHHHGHAPMTHSPHGVMVKHPSLPTPFMLGPVPSGQLVGAATTTTTLAGPTSSVNTNLATNIVASRC